MNKLLYLHRFLSLLSGALILPFAALAQTGGVGIGTVTPNTRLEVNGGFSLTETTSPALTGANPAYSIPTNVSQIRLVPGGTAPTGTVALNSITPVSGQHLTVYNGTAIPATLSSQTVPAGSAITFVYSNGSWRTTSASGPAGATGPAGASGPAGTAGATGPAGASGPAGTAGATGPAGANGPAGTAGATGPAGVTGATGSIGPAGPMGAAGSNATVAAGPGLSSTVSGSTTTVKLGGSALTAATDVPLAGNNLTFTGGKVGIGTAPPTFTLEVKHNNGTPVVGNANGLAISHVLGPTWTMYVSNTANSLQLYYGGVKEVEFTPDGSVNTVSDSTAKTQIRLVEDGQVARLMQLRPKSYLYKRQFSSQRQYGLMAQDLAAVYPNLAQHGIDDDGKAYWTVNYIGLVPVLVKALQEQELQRRQQETRLVSLEAQVKLLQQQFSQSGPSQLGRKP